VRAARVPLQPLVKRRLAAVEVVEAMVLPERLGAPVATRYAPLKTLGLAKSFARHGLSCGERSRSSTNRSHCPALRTNCVRSASSRSASTTAASTTKSVRVRSAVCAAWRRADPSPGRTTLEEFLVEWWDTYAVTHLRPNTLATYTTLLDRWIVPYLGRKRLREVTRQTIDAYCARIRADGAGAPTVNRALGVLQGVFHRAVEWRRLAWNPVVGTRRLTHSRATTIDARIPETVEAVRARLDRQNAALVSVLAYEGLRPGEAYALVWSDVLDDRGRPRKRLLVQHAISGDEVTTPKSARAREPELFAPVARELAELHLAQGRPQREALVFPDAAGGHLRRQNWRRRVWIPALERAGVPYFRSYDLRHTCATLLLYEGRTLNEVAEHLGHADPGFTARTYAHVMRDASRRRRVPIAQAIRTARRRPLVDPSASKTTSGRKRSGQKSLEIERADARTRTGDPFITSEVLYQLSYVGGT
jgi:integrase